ncbi:uncharacterized protein V1510DRAFT_215056 [Dipodascopsis tothii]|uniref:uncharacterized protein n=1 Tax=Dipodascopsis tothii TaxID=44089 RepID=UPI0034CE3809
MSLFRKRSKADGPSGKENFTKEDRRVLKTSEALQDPILSAMVEEQPFQVSANRGEVQTSPDMNVRDIFGNKIVNPDLSNPTRSRDERPLDTIRGFEYSANGDKAYRDYIFRERLPWDERRAYGSSPYGAVPPPPPPQQQPSYSQENVPRAPIQFGGDGSSALADEYNKINLDAIQASKDKKKKKGLFRRSKN